MTNLNNKNQDTCIDLPLALDSFLFRLTSLRIGSPHTVINIDEIIIP